VKISGVTVRQFFEDGRDKLPLELVGGEKGLGRVIHEPAINRPGLALAGFFRHFAFRRIQVLGMAENEYLLNLPPARRKDCLRRLFGERIPCVVITRNRRVLPEISDLAREFNIPILRSPLVTGHFINSATIAMERLAAPRITRQGTMVDILGVGVLIEGKPCIGKSEAALSLVERGHSLVADDLVLLRLSDRHVVIGSALPSTRYHIEIRGVGIVHIPSLFGVASVRDEKALDLIVTLREMGEVENGGIGLDPLASDLLGVKVPRMIIPVAPGRELANIIQAAALNEKLKKLGHDAAKELDEKLMAKMSKGAPAK